ncbi:MAG TPA: hypothetical protein VGJ84_04660 [Polyangiaceae bacterium]|jgi:hypothetical protein
MLPPFIIDQIRRREEEERRKRGNKQPQLELPVDAFPPRPDEDGEQEEESNRGITIISFV